MPASRCFLLLTCFLSAPFLSAQPSGSTSFSLKTTLAESYLFRGRTFSDRQTFLGEFGVVIAKWSYNLTYARPTGSESDGFDTFDVEYTHNVSYTTIAAGKIITYGYQYFDYGAKGQQPDTQEIFTRVAYNSRWNPTFGLAVDMDTYRGYYLDASVTRFWPVTRRTKLLFNMSGGFSYDLKEERTEDRRVVEPGFFGKNGFNHGEAQVDYLWQPSDWLKAEIGVHYHHAFDDDLYESPLVDRAATVWQVGISMTFP